MGETNIFKVLADKQRRDILVMLKDGRMNAGEIAEKLEITPAALSYHLKLLKGADLIMEYKQKMAEYNAAGKKKATMEKPEEPPLRMLFISVPVSTIPAVKVSMKKYSNEAFLLRILTGLFFLISSSSLFKTLNF